MAEARGSDDCEHWPPVDQTDDEWRYPETELSGFVQEARDMLARYGSDDRRCGSSLLERL